MGGMTWKKIAFTFIVFLTFVAFSLSFFYREKINSNLNVEKIFLKETNASHEVVKADQYSVTNVVGINSDAHKSISTDNSAPKILSVYGNAKEEAEVKKWCSARGAKCALEQKDEKIYEAYDVATLESLSNNGDIRAMHHLAERYARTYIDKGDSDKGFELRNQLYVKAAIYGSTDALLRLGFAAYTGMLKSSLQGRELALESLAYYEVAAIRGDRFGKVLMSDLPVKENELVLTDADHAYIETRAEEIYQDLQRKRHDLGLGEFDNEIPESVKRYFDRIQ
ncbi:MAG: hypothetical protein AAGC78_20065 [Cellvibrio sp.]|uniref:hypothetical protein n=1 Tax=Cellvibrio sp. TaxID=1965322 RepID=UPI0031A146CE